MDDNVISEPAEPEHNAHDIELENEPDEVEPELDTDLNIKEEDVEMTGVPDTEEGYSPSQEDAKTVSEVVPDTLMDSFKKFSKESGISLGLHQRLLSFQLKAARDGVTDDATLLSKFKAFGKKERMSQNLFNAIVKFQTHAAGKLKAGIERIQVSSAQATGKPNPRAHEIYHLANSHSYLAKNNTGHKAAVKKMLELCGQTQRRKNG